MKSDFVVNSMERGTTFCGMYIWITLGASCFLLCIFLFVFENMITFNDPRIVFYFNMLLKYDLACLLRPLFWLLVL